MTFTTPSLAKKIGHALHTVARQMKTKSRKHGNQEMKKSAKKCTWETEVSHAAGDALENWKYNKPTRAPLADDLKALTAHLKNKATELFKISRVTEKEWKEMTLAQIVLFNKKDLVRPSD